MRLLLERALLPSGVADEVLVEIEDGRLTAVAPAVVPAGVAIPMKARRSEPRGMTSSEQPTSVLPWSRTRSASAMARPLAPERIARPGSSSTANG